MEHTIYTIGYSGFTQDEFVKAMKDHGINVVVDVRSYPYSQYFKDFNRPEIMQRLESEGIYYRNYAEEFGARQDDLSFYSSDGILDFEKFSKSEKFQRGVNKLCKSMEADYTIALMCAEKKPVECHRTILVARAFWKRGYTVVHICPDGMITQKKIEDQLLNRYFPDREQLSFLEKGKSDLELLNEAYRLCNKEIGYHREINSSTNYEKI